MGEMADYINDPWEEEGNPFNPPSPIRCRCCGTTGLHWLRGKHGGWHLYNSKRCLHNCPVNPLPKHKK